MKSVFFFLSENISAHSVGMCVRFPIQILQEDPMIPECLYAQSQFLTLARMFSLGHPGCAGCAKNCCHVPCRKGRWSEKKGSGKCVLTSVQISAEASMRCLSPESSCRAGVIAIPRPRLHHHCKSKLSTALAAQVSSGRQLCLRDEKSSVNSAA